MVMERADAQKPHATLEPGYRLGADLTVLDHIGGTRKVDIYLCRSRKFGEKVACKILRPEHSLDYAALEAIMREGRTLPELDHPNIVHGFDVEVEGYPRVVATDPGDGGIRSDSWCVHVGHSVCAASSNK